MNLHLKNEKQLSKMENNQICFNKKKETEIEPFNGLEINHTWDKATLQTTNLVSWLSIFSIGIQWFAHKL